jgi:hypothetical protein
MLGRVRNSVSMRPLPSRTIRLLFVTGLLLALGGCARHYTPDSIADPYGFFSGVWHGMIFTFSLLANILSWIAGLFDFHILENVQIIGRPNSGFFYYFGFVLGLLIFGGGGASGASR